MQTVPVHTIASFILHFDSSWAWVVNISPRQRFTRARGLYFFSMVSKTKIINSEKDFFVHHRLPSEVKKVEFVSDRASYIYIYIYIYIQGVTGGTDQTSGGCSLC